MIDKWLVMYCKQDLRTSLGYQQKQGRRQTNTEKPNQPQQQFYQLGHEENRFQNVGSWNRKKAIGIQSSVEADLTQTGRSMEPNRGLKETKAPFLPTGNQAKE